jgi:DNA-binding MarR family transcriptional regulator
VVDRLEQADLARRARDPNDRRRVVLELLHDPKREREIGALYMSLGQKITELVAQYSAAERATILDFLTKATAALETETLNLRLGAAADKTQEQAVD